MKAISLWQPWATLIAVGAKKIETRSWATSYRGPLAIHAAKTWSGELQRLCFTEPFLTALERGWVQDHRDRIDYMDRSIRLPRGAIVAVCELADCVQSRGGDGAALLADETVVDDPEWSFGDYSPGRWAWKLADIRPLPEPIPYRGAQGIFDVPDELFGSPTPAADTPESVAEKCRMARYVGGLFDQVTGQFADPRGFHRITRVRRNAAGK